MQHQLNVKIDDDLKSTSFVIRDFSYYYTNMPVQTPVLEVYAPSSENPVIFTDLDKYFVKAITVNDLHLNSNGSYPLPNLPDGAYFIRWSVAPNLKVYIAYYYFRIVRLEQKYLNLIEETIKSRPYLNRLQYDRKIQTLLWYKELIDCSKYMAQEKLDIAGANEIYKEVDELLTKFNKCEEC